MDGSPSANSAEERTQPVVTELHLIQVSLSGISRQRRRTHAPPIHCHLKRRIARVEGYKEDTIANPSGGIAVGGVGDRRDCSLAPASSSGKPSWVHPDHLPLHLPPSCAVCSRWTHRRVRLHHRRQTYRAFFHAHGYGRGAIA